MIIQQSLNDIKKSCLVLDLETSAFYSNGQEISIRTNYDDYISNAKIKFFGAYSYKYNKQYYINCQEESQKVTNLLKEHKILIGFNNEEFDYPILVNNGYTSNYFKYLNVDCMQILGANTKQNRNGYKFKGRGALMNYKFKKASLKHMAEVMELKCQKGDIDYKIFHKTSWTPEEQKEIIQYLSNDVMATKQMFDKLWLYWLPFTKLLNQKNIEDLSWLRSSIASLTYKSACHFMNVNPTYGDQKLEKDEVGGRVIDPAYEEETGVWYVDFASLYPHIFCMFNLFAEQSKDDKFWHGNKMFEVEGYYDISKPHILAESVKARLQERITLKKTEPNSPMIYALKIFLNGLYGIVRSSIFEQVHTPNAGRDCCLLGQQIHKYTEQRMTDFGFKTIYGDTDSLMLITDNQENNNKNYVKMCLTTIVHDINKNAPFQIDTFSIDIENYLEYVMFPFSEQTIQDEEGKNIKKGKRLVKERKGRKKNYLYIYKKDDKLEIKLVGLPIMKDNATHLGIKIYNEVLKPLILEKKSAKFPKEFIETTLTEYLKNEEVMKLMAREYKVNSFDSYKLESQIQAQISKHYFNGVSGVIELIKNKKIGKVGKGMTYCTVKEAIQANLTAQDLDLEKIYNELEPFIKYEESIESKKKFDKKVVENKQVKKKDLISSKKLLEIDKQIEILQKQKEQLKDNTFAEEVSKKIHLTSSEKGEVQDLNSAPNILDDINNKFEQIQKKKLETKINENFNFSDLIIKELDFATTKEFIIKNHYSYTLGSGTKANIGFFYKNELVTAIVYGNPIGINVSSWLKVPKDSYAELVRVFSRDDLPNNTESYCLGQSFKWLKENRTDIKYLISYADVTQGHVGYIYQATNWYYVGTQGGNDRIFIIDGKQVHRRTANATYGTSSVKKLKEKFGNRLEVIITYPKHIYLMCLGNKREKRNFYKNFKQKPYPKIDLNK